MSHKLEDLLAKINKLTEEAAKKKLQVNVEKMEVIKIPNQQQEAPITSNGRNLKEVVSFTYPGKTALFQLQAAETQMRMSKPGSEKQNRLSFINLKSVWTSTALSTKNKIRISNTNSVKSLLLYGSETWRVTKGISDKPQTFINSCLLSILKIRWPERISNRNSGWLATNQPTNQEPIAQQICQKWRWIGVGIH
ncbi:unnamed protein product [Heterobilharzia americana]|nr:unnamed protein product [Heterobilharzia americana]